MATRFSRLLPLETGNRLASTAVTTISWLNGFQQAMAGMDIANADTARMSPAQRDAYQKGWRAQRSRCKQPDCPQ